MSRPVVRRLAVLSAAGSCLAAAAVPALAAPTVGGSPSSPTVSTTVAAGPTRQLNLYDLTGAPLSSVALRAGAPTPFRVQVSDTGVTNLLSPDSGFTVTSVLNNLYKDGNPSAAFIPSSDVAVSFPSTIAQDATGSITALPRTVLSGSLPGCTSLFSLLPSLSGLSILSGAGLNLCDAVGAGGLTVPATEVLTSAEQTISDLAAVPFTLGGQQSGSYSLANYLYGIGNGDSRGSGAGTGRNLLTGVPNVSAALQTQLDAIVATLQALPEVSPTGTGAQASMTDAVAALLADPATSALGNALAGLSATQATDVLNLLTGTVQAIGLGDITSAAGTYNSFPVLTATPTGSPAQGTYSGTMTVTLVQP